MRPRLLVLPLLFACSRTPEEISSQPAAATTPARAQSVAAPATTPEQAPATIAQSTIPSGEGWNPAGIAWLSYDEALVVAKKDKKPVCIIMYGTWCEHCRNYSHVFYDPRMVARAKDFAMVRVDVDANPAIAKRYNPDGDYVPRTYFLDSSGNVNPHAQSDHPRFKHFFDEMHADSLLEAMDDAIATTPH